MARYGDWGIIRSNGTYCLRRWVGAVVSLLLAAGGGGGGGGAAAGETYEVGGEKGWILGGFNYAEWAKLQRFQAGDTLLFQYPPGDHSVLQVREEDYKGCVTSRPVLEASSGNDLFVLARGGSYWFICGLPEHCSAGMKFFVKATTESTHPSRPAAITTTSSTPHTSSRSHDPHTTTNDQTMLIAYPTSSHALTHDDHNS